MTYAEKLKDPRWQKKRLEILQQHDFTCQHCRDKSTTLHVHHIFYRPKADPWDYTNDALVTLCEKCHSIESLPLTELQRFLWITIVCTCAESSIIQDARDRIINVHANSVNHG